MKHKLISCLPFFLLLLGVLVSCDDDDSSTSSTSPDVAVASFVLVDNDSVLDDLSSAFFSIDLIAGSIYNADSLPYGTDISELAVTMTFTSTPSDVIIYTCDGEAIDYFDDETIEMDFTSEAKMLVIAPDEVTQKYYTIKINVHTVVPDSLYWSELSSDYAVPATSAIQAMKVVSYQDNVLALVEESDSTLTCYTAESAESEWSAATTLSGWYDVNSLQAGTDSLYILDSSNILYTSVDGVNWTSTEQELTSLIGVYPADESVAEQLLVVTTTPKRGVYKEGVLVEETAILPSLFPVSGYSNSLIYASESVYSSAVLLYIIGGETASGSLTNAVWAYNGTNWSSATMNNIEMDTCVVSPRKGAALIGYQSYPTYEVYDYPYVVYDTWIVMGGIDEDGEYLSDIYTSMSKGVRWEDPDGDLLVYPTYMSPAAYLSVIVQDNVVSTRGATRSWQLLETPTITTALQTRSTSDTERTAPYIYMYGGETKSGEVENTVWRGVIERLTFPDIE